MSQYDLPWEENEDNGSSFSENTPPEEMSPAELIEYVQCYSLKRDPLYPIELVQGLKEVALFTDEFFHENEQLYFTCLLLCADRIEQVNADFLFSDDGLIDDKGKLLKTSLMEEKRGALLDLDVSPWDEREEEYAYIVGILQNMRDIFESLLRDSLDRRLVQFGCRYVIAQPSDIIVVAPKEDVVYRSELIYYPQLHANTFWGYVAN